MEDGRRSGTSENLGLMRTICACSFLARSHSPFLYAIVSWTHRYDDLLSTFFP